MSPPQSAAVKKATLSLASQLAAVQDWWSDAGVEQIFHDEPQAWLGVEETHDPKQASSPNTLIEKGKTEAAPPAPRMGGDPASWPQSLETWREWWVDAAAFDFGISAPRILPRGKQGAALMVLVPMPEVGDSDILLSGPQGQMIGNLARAMGIGTDNLYVASALPSHMPAPDWPGLETAGLGRIVRHHVALVRPASLLVLGQGILPLMEHDPAQDTALRDETEIQGQQTKAYSPKILGSYAPELLLERGRLRAKLWRRLLNWTN